MAQKYRNPTPTVDIIIAPHSNPDGVYLIQRKNPPYGWAIPGGFVDEGEPLWQAACREAKEELGVDIDLLEQFHTYSDPRRDPRKHTVSTVFLAQTDQQPRAGDDAKAFRLFSRKEIMILELDQSQEPPTETTMPMVFDHKTILKDYFIYKDTGKRPPAKR